MLSPMPWCIVIAARRCDTGLRLILMHAKWGQSKRQFQAANILWWWEKVEEILRACKARSCWEVPWGFPDPIARGVLKEIDVDYQKARQKAKKAERRAI